MTSTTTTTTTTSSCSLSLFLFYSILFTRSHIHVKAISIFVLFFFSFFLCWNRVWLVESRAPVHTHTLNMFVCLFVCRLFSLGSSLQCVLLVLLILTHLWFCTGINSRDRGGASRPFTRADRRKADRPRSRLVHRLARTTKMQPDCDTLYYIYFNFI